MPLTPSRTSPQIYNASQIFSLHCGHNLLGFKEIHTLVGLHTGLKTQAANTFEELWLQPRSLIGRNQNAFDKDEDKHFRYLPRFGLSLADRKRSGGHDIRQCEKLCQGASKGESSVYHARRFWRKQLDHEVDECRADRYPGFQLNTGLEPGG